MGIGNSMQASITSTINILGSDIVITEYTDDTSDGGYSGDGETTVSTQNETAIPYEQFSKLIKGKYGDLEAGGTQIALKFDVVIDINTDSGSKYKVTWQDEIYDVIRVNRYPIQNIAVATIITVSKRLG